MLIIHCDIYHTRIYFKNKWDTEDDFFPDAPKRNWKLFPKEHIPGEYSVNDNSDDDDDDKNEVYDYADNNDGDSLHLLRICCVVGTQFAYITWSSQHSREAEI